MCPPIGSSGAHIVHIIDVQSVNTGVCSVWAAYIVVIYSSVPPLTTIYVLIKVPLEVCAIFLVPIRGAFSRSQLFLGRAYFN